MVNDEFADQINVARENITAVVKVPDDLGGKMGLGFSKAVGELSRRAVFLTERARFVFGIELGRGAFLAFSLGF